MEDASPQTEVDNKQDILRLNPRHHIITDEITRAGGFAAKTRFKENLAAIRLLRELEASGREATHEEKRVLAGYVGWGGLADAVDIDRPYIKTDWRKEHDEIRQLIHDGIITRDELASMQASTINAHYTSPEVVRAIWQAIEHMGYAPKPGEYGRILEPSVGTGNFLGLAPASIIERSHFMAVEKETIAGGIARQLYPDADIRVSPFEEVKTPIKFDVVVGNVPFGNVMIYDKDYLKENLSIHNYFLVRSLDMTKPGGIVALITSSYTMDAPGNQTVRELLAERGELMGAIRLPTSAFEAQANTTVTTDILFFRRYLPGAEKDIRPDWIEVGTVTVPSPLVSKEEDDPSESQEVELKVNRYFLQHPEMIASDAPIKARRHRYQRAAEIQIDMPADLENTLKAIVEQHLPVNVFAASLVSKAASESMTIPAMESRDTAETQGVSRARVGSFVIMNDGGLGEITHVDSAASKILIAPYEAPNAKAEKRIRAYIGVRDAMLDLLDAELQSAEDTPEVEQARKTLNDRYDAFVAAHGPMNLPVNERLFRQDTLSSFVFGLENYNPETRTATKADFFTKRTVGPVQKTLKAETPEDALMMCLAEHGRVIPHMIANVYLQMPWEEAYDVLKGRIFLDPTTNTWETADRYLSGNVIEKLEAAEDAAKGDAFFMENVQALRQVQPSPIPFNDIHIQLGAPWIPVEDYQAFAEVLLKPRYRNPIEVKYDPIFASWSVTFKDRRSILNTMTWGTPQKPAHEILEDLLNQREIRVTKKDPISDKYVLDVEGTLAAQSKAAAIQQEFKKWVGADESRVKRLEVSYNKRFNNLRIPRYDGSHLTFPGMSPFIKLRPHQKNAVWNYIQEGVLIAAHEVGLGKTFMMIAAAMESRRLGLARKPLAVVPNHMLQQFANEARQLYPTANILVMDKENMTPRKRQAFLGKAVMQDWDLCIITQDQFSRIPLSPKKEAEFIEAELRYLRIALQSAEDGDKRSYSLKQIQGKIENYEAKLKKLVDAMDKDDTVYFDHLGFDMLLVDEAHHYKNRETPTNIQGVSGINTQGSQRTADMVSKILNLYEKNGGERGLIFATGTPISNSLSEAFNLIRTVKPSILEQWGTESFDAFVAQFMEKRSQVEVSADSVTHKIATRLYPVNVPEMMTALRTIMDVQRADDHRDIIKRPEAETIMVTAERSYLQEIYSLELAERAQACARKSVNPKEDNILKIASDGRKASLDLRLVDPVLPDFEESKVNRLVDHVYQVWSEHHDTKAAQIIFCDQGVPGPDKMFSVYDDVRMKLVARGIPPQEIAFIHEAKDDDAKEELFDRVRKGEVRVLMGSTEKMGTGTNVQRRLIAIHHLDAPWRPSDIEQRDGRIIRQGNIFENVKRYIYTTRGSFDTFMWQLMKAKSESIQSIMRCDPGVRTFDENGDTTYEDVLAVTTGNPYIREKIDIERRISVLEAEERAAVAEARHALTTIRLNESTLEAQKEKRHYIQSMLKAVESYLAQHPELGLTMEDIKDRSKIDGLPIWSHQGQPMTRKACMEALEQHFREEMRQGKLSIMLRARVECLGLPVDVEHDNVRGGERFTLVHKHKGYATTSQPWRIEDALSNLHRELAYIDKHEEALRKENQELQLKTLMPEGKTQEIEALRQRLQQTIQLMNEESEKIMAAMRAKGGYRSLDEWKQAHRHLLNEEAVREEQMKHFDAIMNF